MSDDIELTHNREPVCPHCQRRYRDSWELPSHEDGDTHIVECPECDAPYKITVNISISYCTAVLSDDERDEYEATPWPC